MMSLILCVRVHVAIIGAVLTPVGCGSPAEPLTSSATPPPVGQTDTAARAPRSIGPQQFAEAIAAPERVTINVHVPYEGDIAGTDLSIGSTKSRRRSTGCQPFAALRWRSTAVPDG
nr:hypothetical protein [Mycolicibacterium rhodesiae]